MRVDPVGRTRLLPSGKHVHLLLIRWDRNSGELMHNLHNGTEILIFGIEENLDDTALEIAGRNVIMFTSPVTIVCKSENYNVSDINEPAAKNH
jgi:hypothetical protein